MFQAAVVLFDWNRVMRWQRVNLFIVSAILLAASGCTTATHGPTPEVIQPDYRRWEQVKVGMSEAEVEALIGKPLKRESPDCPGKSTVYLATYGIIRYDERNFPSPYEFYVIYHCRDHCVDEKNDPFGGNLSLDGTPTVPKLIYPVDHQKFDHYPRYTDFRWTPSSGVYPMSYEVQTNWQPEDGWDGPGVETYKTTEPYLAVSWGGKGRGVWRVRAINRLGTSAWSVVRSFSFDR